MSDEKAAHSAGHGVGSTLDGKYRLEALVGSGGMGLVYAARHQFTGREVAVKVLLPHHALDVESRARFLREAQASARIRHANVVDIFDVGEDQGSVYLVMELLHGCSLREHLDRSGPMPLADAFSIIAPLLDAVEAAHNNGVIHRDIKPENIFLRVDRAGKPLPPKLLDLGISKLDGAAAATRSRSSMGTFWYMSPEQMRDSSRVSPATDIYALGVTLFECMTGRRPYSGTNITEYLLAMRDEEPLRLDEVLSGGSDVTALGGALAKAYAPGLDQRYPDVPTFRAALAPVGLKAGRLPVPSGLGERPLAASPITDDELRDSSAHFITRVRPSGLSERLSSPGMAMPGSSSDSGTRSPRTSNRGLALASAVVVCAAGALGLWFFGGTATNAAATMEEEPTGTAQEELANGATLPPAVELEPTEPVVPVSLRLQVAAPAWPGAQIQLNGEQRGDLDADGEVSLSVDPGNYTVVVVHHGQVVATEEVSVVPGSTLSPLVFDTPAEQDDEARSGGSSRQSRRSHDQSASRRDVAATQRTTLSPPPTPTAAPTPAPAATRTARSTLAPPPVPPVTTTMRTTWAPPTPAAN